MRTSFVALFSFVASTLAYQVTFPQASDKWYSGQVTNQLKWERVNTDATTFTVVLTNQNRNVLPTDQQLMATTDGTTGMMAVPAPSGGFPVGKGFRVNLVNSTTELNTIYAQSPEFEIVSGISTSSGATSSTSISRGVMTVVPTTSSTPTTTSDPINQTGGPNATSGAGSLVARASPVVGAFALLAALLA